MTIKLLAFLRAKARIVRFLADDRGASAAEFALILPIMLIMYFGTWGICQTVSLNRLVALTASTVTNLVTQYTTISQSSQMPDILAASTQVLSQFPASKAVVTVSSINIDATGKATIGWSQSLNGTPRTVGATVTLPAALDTPNSSVIFGETAYPFTPGVPFPNFGTFNLYSSVYMQPRASTYINLVP